MKVTETFPVKLLRDMTLWDQLQSILDTRNSRGLLRKLKPPTKSTDFSSNDYLGLARTSSTTTSTGSGGSRLLSGNSLEATKLEQHLATHHGAESALLFNSGYDANLGLFSTLAQPGDVYLYDSLIHASVHDGMKASRASRLAFRHNDLEHLESLLKASRNGNMFIAVERVYSMDGDMAPLQQLHTLTKRYPRTYLIIDEAHATGVMQPSTIPGIKIITFGKAIGCHGACILGPEVLKQYLVNYARPLVFSTAIPPSSCQAVLNSYRFIEQHPEIVTKLHVNIRAYRLLTKGLEVIGSETAIQGFICPGNERVGWFAAELQKRGLDVRPIKAPTVPAGKERLRICIHAHNTMEEIEHLVSSIRQIMALELNPTSAKL